MTRRVLKALLYERQNGRCTECKVFTLPSGMEIDHRWPKARGGADIPPNLQLLCKRCNRRKSANVDAGTQKTLWDQESNKPLSDWDRAIADATSTPEGMREFYRLKKARRRAEARAKGNCGICCTRPAGTRNDGRKAATCSYCRRYFSDLRRRRVPLTQSAC